MIHALFEFSPFLAGLLTGFFAYFRSPSHRLRPSLLAGASLAIGGACSLLAGELAQGIATAVLCIAWDSGLAAIGAVAAHLVFRRMWA